MSVAKVLIRAAFVCCLVAGASLHSALAQALPRYEVTGFREILFGMTEQEVRNAAIKTFGISAKGAQRDIVYTRREDSRRTHA